MNTPTKNGLLPALKKILTGASLALVLVGSFAGTAHAYDRDWRGHEYRAHRDWHYHHPHPGYVYAPPVVYAPPPPVQSPGLNLILPLNFR